MCVRNISMLSVISNIVIGQLQENDEALSMWIFDEVVAGDKLTK